MKKRKLGSNGPEISVVGFGAWEAGGMGWGENPPDTQTLEAIRSAVDAGCTWVDTAEAYGGGRSEELVRKALGTRDDVLVFTKVAPKPSGSGFGRDQVRRGVEGSLRRLGRERVDVYQLHWPDRRTPVEETWEAMAGLVDDGLVRWIGVSNFRPDLLERCESLRHVDSVQPHFSMLHRDPSADLFPLCEANGTGIVAYGPLGFGLLTGAIGRGHRFHEDDWRGGGHGTRAYDSMFAAGKLEKNLDVVDRLRPVAERAGITLSQLALAWVHHQRGVTGAIAGSRSPEHVRQNAVAGSVDLDDKTLDELDSILAEA